MANYFLPNYVIYGDRAGLGRYEVGHFLQHQQYLQVFAARSILLPDYNILHMQANESGEFSENEFAWWLNQHQNIHAALAQRTGVSGVDLSYFDLKSSASWEVWQQAHILQHRGFDQVLGTT